MNGERQLTPQEIEKFSDPRYGRSVDQMDQYGSIIKDLTDTHSLLEQMRLDILGRKMVDGKEMQVKSRKNSIDPAAAYEFVRLIKAIVNQNTHFSRFDGQTIQQILKAVNYHSNRFLMLQGGRVPLRYRANMATEAMLLVTGSVYKASDGTILRWTKGSFADNRQLTEGPQAKSRGFWEKVFGVNK